MPRIAGINIPDNKKIEVALTQIYGIGFSLSNNILNSLKIKTDKKSSELTQTEMTKLREKIEKDVLVEGELKRKIRDDIKRLKNINCYRGTRHTKGLPARGQRSKTNNRTVRGNIRKTVGSGRKPAPQAT